ncbi:MAG: hypothetical protein AB8B92_03460 [Gammaproteobacteria bacterium]
MNVKAEISQLNNLANELLENIENELWDETKILSQKWDAKIRRFVQSLSAKQFITMKNEIENISSQNTIIEKRLIDLRAKVLTQIQENEHTRTAIQFYNKTA